MYHRPYEDYLVICQRMGVQPMSERDYMARRELEKELEE